MSQHTAASLNTASFTLSRVGRRYALSERELAVADLLATGLPNKVIGDQLGLALSTVKNRITVVLAKTHSRNRTEAALKLAGLLASLGMGIGT